MKNTRSLPVVLLAPALVLGLADIPASAAQDSAPEAKLAAPASELDLVFDRRAAEHLLNRAGFGARPDAIEAAVAAGLEATVDGLFLPPERQLPRETAERLVRKDGAQIDAYEELRRAGGQDAAPQELIEAAQDAGRKMRREDRAQLTDYTVWWFDTMASGADPLRDRMTLFWHGYFTSSFDDVRSSFQLIEQNQLLRAGALGSFRELLFGVAKDPAMLEYLDNDENRKQEPNENFAREVMELFTLGEGNYTEGDVKEAARAFTGWRARNGEFQAFKRQHDSGEKTVLGVTGKLDGEDVLEILLEQEACALHVTGQLLSYLEGVEPSGERLEHYAGVLRGADYDVGTLLRALFLDPDFYRDEVVGQRVAGPIDYLVGMARRLDITPPEAWYTSGSQLLGQQLFHPPNVKGWDEGMAWITTASLMQRGNLAGILVGAVDASEVLTDQDEMFSGMEMDAAMDGAMDDMGSMDDTMAGGDDIRAPKVRYGALTGLKSLGRWQPRLGLAASLRRAGAVTAEQVVDQLTDTLLAIELPAETRAFLVAEYQALMAAPTGSGRAEPSSQRQRPRARFRQAVAERSEREDVLAHFAHLILSLPEAQLH